MPDPTHFVLSQVFLTAAGLFLISAILRRVRRGRTVRVAAWDGVSDAVEVVLPPCLPRGRVPVWFYRPLDLLGIAFVFLVFGGLALSAGQGPEDSIPSLSPLTLVVNIAFQFILAGVVTTLVIWRASPVLWLGLRWSSWLWILLICPAAVVCVWLFSWGLQAAGYMKWMESLGVETVQDTIKVLQKTENPLVLALMSFAAVIAAPICEEIVFRGYFYPAMKKFAGIWPAAMVSALVFGAAHGNLTALPPLFVFGLLLVFLYEKTGSLWAPVAVHFCFNSASIVLQLAARYFNIPLDSAP